MAQTLRSLALAALVTAAVTLAGCGDEGLPNENGVYWNCFGQLSFSPSESQPELVGTIGQVGRVCGNPDVPEADVRDACDDQCNGDFFDFLVDLGEKVVTAGQGSHDCAIDSVQKTGERCRDPLVDPAGAGPAQYRVSISSASSPLSVSIEDETGHSSASGFVRYTIAEPCTADCKLVITEIVLSAAPFEFGGETVTNASIISYGNVFGTLFADGRIAIPTGALRVSANFDYDGEHGSITELNDRPIGGFLDRATGLFSLGEVTIPGSGATITFKIQGQVVSTPPQAVASVPSSVECDAAGAGSLTLDGTASSATSGSLVDYLWSALPPSPPFSGNFVFLGRGATVSSALPLGTSLVELFVVDSNGAADVASTNVEVVDTTRPTLVAPAQGKITTCSPEAEEVVIQLPAVTDVCDPAPTLTAAIVAQDGETLATPVPVVGGRVTLSPGEFVVRFTATDASGNVATLDQAFDVVSTPTLYATAGLSLGAATVVALPGGGFGSIVNSGRAQTVLDARAQSGDVLSVGQLLLRNSARVNGFVRTTRPVALDLGAVITGPVFIETPLIVPDFPSLSVSPASFGTQTVEVGSPQVLTLAPGGYGPVRVLPGATLGLVGGSYSFAALRVEPGAQVRVDRSAGPVTVYVRDALLLQGPVTDAAGGFPNLFVGYLGSSAVFLQSQLRGTLVAPSAAVDLSTASGLVEGGLFARTIRIQPETAVIHRPYACTP